VLAGAELRGFVEDTHTSTIDPVPSATKDPRPAARRRTLRIAVIGVSIALVLTGIASFWHWRTHPEVFPDIGIEIKSTVAGPQRTFYVGVTDPDPDGGSVVSIESASPRIVENTAGATFEFFICTLHRREGSSASVGAVQRGDITRLCADVVPAEGRELDTREQAQEQLVMLVTLRRSGFLRAQGVDVTYSRGWRRGTEFIGVGLHFRSR
jgi:hypothetical protein